MTHENRVTHRELMEQLRSSIARLREDVEARIDPGLAEIADALELIMDLVAHTHDSTLENRARIEELEAGATRQA